MRWSSSPCSGSASLATWASRQWGTRAPWTCQRCRRWPIALNRQRRNDILRRFGGRARWGPRHDVGHSRNTRKRASHRGSPAGCCLFRAVRGNFSWCGFKHGSDGDRTLRTGGRGERRAFTVGARGPPDFRCACVGTRLSVSSSSRGCCESTVVLGGFTHRRTGPPYLTQNSDLRVEVPNTLLYSSSRGAVLRGDAFSSVRRLPFPL